MKTSSSFKTLVNYLPTDMASHHRKHESSSTLLWEPDTLFGLAGIVCDGGFIVSFNFQSFGLLEKKSVKIPGIRDFSWSPTDNVLAYWVAEDKDVPARVTLLEIPRWPRFWLLIKPNSTDYAKHLLKIKLGWYLQEIMSGLAEHPSIPYVHDTGSEIAYCVCKMVWRVNLLFVKVFIFLGGYRHWCEKHW